MVRRMASITTALLAASAGAQAGVELYPAPGATNDSRIEIRVGERAAPFAKRRIFHSDSAGEYAMEIAFVRFAANGPQPVQVRLEVGAPDPLVLRSVTRDIPARRARRGAYDFELPGAGHYYLRLPALAASNSTFTVAFWVDDLDRLRELRAQLAAGGAANVTNCGVRPDPALDQTAALQSLLDRSGALVFPEGIYRAGSLRLHSDTTLFFAPGAVLRALEREDAVGPEFIAIDHARNVKLCGPGTVDAGSFSPRRKHNVHNLNITSSRDVTLEDLLLEDSNSWAVHIRKSDRVSARNVRVFSGKDGFDPDASRDVLIDAAFVVSGDDAVAVKNRFPHDADGQSTERVTFRNSIVSTFKSALKIGTETQGPIRDVTFESCDVFDSDRGVVLYARDGGPIERARWRNLRMHFADWPREKDSGTALHLIIDRREGATPVRDCSIENVTANWIYRSEFAGLRDAPLNGVTLSNLHLKVEAPRSGRPPLFVCGGNVSVEAQELTVDWQGNEGKWAGVVAGTGLKICPKPALASQSSNRPAGGNHLRNEND